MHRKIRWGLLGAGKILDRWMKGARQIDDMEIVAVASRTRESAEKNSGEVLRKSIRPQKDCLMR